MDYALHPKHSLIPRIAYVALETDTIVGFIAGHLTRRYECDGELQWINIIPEYRGNGIASELLLLLATWFRKENALRICVDVDPSNIAAQNFYKKHGAEKLLNTQWLVWENINTILKK